jgi:hypothetical protein
MYVFYMTGDLFEMILTIFNLENRLILTISLSLGQRKICARSNKCENIWFGLTYLKPVL